MNSNEEIIPSHVLDWINKKLIEFDKRLDEFDKRLDNLDEQQHAYRKSIDLQHHAQPWQPDYQPMRPPYPGVDQYTPQHTNKQPTYLLYADPYGQTQYPPYTDPWQQDRVVYQPPPPTGWPPPPQRSPSCWSSTISHHQAVSGFEQSAAQQQPLPERPSSCWSLMSHSRSAAPLPAAAAVVQPSNLPPPTSISLPCSPDISGKDGELLDEDPTPLAAITLPCNPNISPALASNVVFVSAVPTPQAAISPTFSPDRIDTLSLAPLATVPPPQTVISPPCSPGIINTAVQHKGKSSTIDGEIEPILTNIEIIGRIASTNQPVIMGVDCLRDTNRGQEHIILADNTLPTHGKTFVQVQHLLNATDTSVGFRYVMAVTRKQIAIKYAYVRYTFDPGGIPRKAKFVIGILRCFLTSTLRARWISTVGS